MKTPAEIRWALGTPHQGHSQAPPFKQVGSIDIGGLVVTIGIEPAGRKFLEIRLADLDISFTLSHALLVREGLDAGIRHLITYTDEASSVDNGG